MDWQGGIRLAISALFAVSHGLKISLLTVLRAVFYVLHLATYPISWLWAVLVFILTPVIHTIRFVLSPLFFIVNNFPRLQPIYIYFGSAAFVGIATGLIFTLTSNGISSLLGLYDKPDHTKRQPSPYNNDYDEEEDKDERQRSTSPPPLRLPDTDQESLEAFLARLDPTDSDLGGGGGGGLLARTGWRDSPDAKRKRRSAAALRIGTILEEDDDDSL